MYAYIPRYINIPTYVLCLNSPILYKNQCVCVKDDLLETLVECSFRYGD